MDYKKQLERFRKRRERIKALRKQGMAPNAIAARLGVTRQRVQQILASK